MSFSIGLDQIVMALIAVVAGIGGWWRGSLPARKLAIRLTHVFEDWNGVEQRPGVPGRPGIMVRLAEIESTQKALTTEVRTHNGGSTLRDAVRRLETAQAVTSQRVEEIAAHVLPAPTNAPASTTAGAPAILERTH